MRAVPAPAASHAGPVPLSTSCSDDSDRHAIADGLSRLLADTCTLYLKTHLLTQRLQVHEKTAWMLRSMLE